MTVLVTGGSGVVGRAVVRRLVEAGRPVKALARSREAAEAVSGLGATPVPGDVLDTDSLAAAVAGCEAVYHVAGVNQFCLRDPSPMHRVNVTGSVNVVDAAASAGVARVVYTSSAVVLGEERGTVGREDSRHRGTFLSAYERSKYDAERAVLRRAEAAEVEVVCVNPSSVQGPGRATGTGEVMMQYLRGRLKLWVPTTVSLVDIDDCAEGHVRAETKGQAGERYVLNGATLESDELLSIMRAVAPGVKPPRLAPPVLAAVAVRLVEATERVRGRTPLVCRESFRALMHGHRYDGSRAERDLGLRYRPAEQTLRRTAEWLVAQGLAPASALG